MINGQLQSVARIAPHNTPLVPTAEKRGSSTAGPLGRKCQMSYHPAQSQTAFGVRGI